MPFNHPPRSSSPDSVKTMLSALRSNFSAEIEATIKHGKVVQEFGEILFVELAAGTEGADVEMGGENAHKKRAFPEAEGGATVAVAYKMKFAPASDPIHIINQLPLAVQKAIMTYDEGNEKTKHCVNV